MAELSGKSKILLVVAVLVGTIVSATVILLLVTFVKTQYKNLASHKEEDEEPEYITTKIMTGDLAMINFVQEYDFQKPFEIKLECKIKNPGVILSKNVSSLGWKIEVDKYRHIMFSSEESIIRSDEAIDNKYHLLRFVYEDGTLNMYKDDVLQKRSEMHLSNRPFPILLGAEMILSSDNQVFSYRLQNPQTTLREQSLAISFLEPLTTWLSTRKNIGEYICSIPC